MSGSTSNQSLAAASRSGAGRGWSQVDDGTYPPRPSAGGSADGRRAVSSASKAAVGSEPSSSMQRRLFGSKGVASLTVDTGPLDKPGDGVRSSHSSRPSQSNSTGVANRPKRGRWHTLEFRFYALVFLVMVPLMVWVPVQLSQPSNPNYSKYAWHLRPGWIAGRHRDDSDFQYRSFRDYIPPLVGIMAIYLLISYTASSIPASRSTSTAGYRRVGAGSRSAEPRNHRKAFLLVFTAIFITALHGTNAAKLMLVLATNYAVAHALGGKRIAPIVIWTLNVGSLFAIHWNDGFKYGKMWHALAFLDDYQGVLPRWQINFNITMLRLVSFSMDLHWAKQQPAQRPQHARYVDGADGDGDGDDAPSPRQRASTSRPPEQYSFVHYFIYVCYPPLFIAGPIMTFNDFTSQIYRPTTIAARSVVSYAVRFLVCLLTMELILHYIYVNAIKDSKAWDGATPLELSMIGFWNLIIVWLKLLVPWRFFRLWAMCDGVDAPENMIRCMANNYSTLGFWRSWHRSYNLWTVRYIYVPVGGTRNRVVATLLVFTFVALWHDLSLKLLTWGWLITFFILPELVGKAVFTEAKYGSRWWYRHLCALGGVFNVLLMMTANLVGFAIGVDGIQYMYRQILGSWQGVQFLVAACATLFVGVQVMFEYRDEERRRGIDRKC
ncbi:probable GUP1 - Multimembrane-spanning protein essential for proton symport of glycerol [Pseudozyma flocculosa]|nr:probable GUP1 - Multimembrane-spanning protein essential for proton symport of glycerol [Pseudozyma flocculosa]